jgi:surface antigen
MRKATGLALALAATLGLMAGLAQVGGAAETATIKQVMKAAMKDGLCKKVGGGQATDAEKKQLLALFSDMAKQKPPKGDEASWKSKSEALVLAAQGTVDGKAGATDQLKKAANCKGCHDVHKGQ